MPIHGLEFFICQLCGPTPSPYFVLNARVTALMTKTWESTLPMALRTKTGRWNPLGVNRKHSVELCRDLHVETTRAIGSDPSGKDQ